MTKDEIINGLLEREAGYRLSCFTAEFIATVSAVTLNNPHATFITGNHFKWWNAAAVHQELEQVVIGLACTFIIEALVKARFDVNIIQMDNGVIYSGATLSGTWRHLGHANSSGADDNPVGGNSYPVSLFIRIL